MKDQREGKTGFSESVDVHQATKSLNPKMPKRGRLPAHLAAGAGSQMSLEPRGGKPIVLASIVGPFGTSQAFWFWRL